MSYPLAAAMMIASGSIHALVNAIVKGGRDKMAARAFTDAAAAVILLPAILIVPRPDGAWGWLTASALGHAIYLYALIRAYQVADLTAAYPVLRGTAPVVTTLVTVGALHEPATPAQVAGIGLIALAMLVLTIGRHIDRAALGWSLLTGLTIATYTVIDAHGVRSAPTPASYIVWLFVVMGGVVLVMFGCASRGVIFANVRTQWRPGAAAGALSIVTYGLALSALAIGPTAPLAALRETGMVTALLIGMFVLKERVTIPRAVAVLAILAGAALIVGR